ncbi:MAG TPA: competence/damage-inducible protein A [Prochlorococcus sp.]
MAEASAQHGVEILCVGTELLLGNILNSNARWLAEELAALGLPHYRQTVVGDNVERLKQSVLEAVDRSRILIVTGGLGPTPDDLTTETLAAVFDTPLEERLDLWIEIQSKLSASSSISAISNRKQALLPCGAEILPNPSGTAPGMIWTPSPGFTVLTFPGVPSEMRQMWSQTAVPWLRQHGGVTDVLVSRLLRFTGIAESTLAEQVTDLLEQDNPTVAPYAGLGEVKLRLTARGKTIEQAKQFLNPVDAELRSRMGVLCYGSDDESLASVVLELLRQRGETVVVAESCTGGGLGAALAAIPRASEVFLGGVIAYSNAIKQSLLGVPAELLDRHGAVSDPVVRVMAEGARQRFGADWSVAVSGVAGPGGGTEAKPVGLVHLAVAGPYGCQTSQEHFAFRRGRLGIQQLSVVRSLDQLRKFLLDRG